jgi:hypothetical protein
MFCAVFLISFISFFIISLVSCLGLLKSSLSSFSHCCILSFLLVLSWDSLSCFCMSSSSSLNILIVILLMSTTGDSSFHQICYYVFVILLKNYIPLPSFSSHTSVLCFVYVLLISYLWVLVNCYLTLDLISMLWLA